MSAKMRALHSSFALGVNVFSYWGDRPDLTPLLAAMGVAGEAGSLEFERKLPIGAGGTPPNLDVVITTADGVMVGVESKITGVDDAKTRDWKEPCGSVPRTRAALVELYKHHQWFSPGRPRAQRGRRRSRVRKKADAEGSFADRKSTRSAACCSTPA